MTTIRQLLRIPERINYDLVFAADDHLKAAAEQYKADRKTGRNTEAWKAYFDHIARDMPDENQNNRAKWVLDQETP